jgi:hypothetical protein
MALSYKFYYKTYLHVCRLQDLSGIVKRDLTGAEIRLKKSILTSYIVAWFSYRILKGHHHESCKIPKRRTGTP